MTIVPVRFSIMYYIIGSLNYSNGTQRDNALAAINSVLSGYTISNVTTSLTAGVNTNGASGLTISVSCKDSDANALRAALLTAWTTGTRATTGNYIVTVKVS